MGKMVTAEAYDGKLVSIDEDKLELFNKKTLEIKKLLKAGKTKSDIEKMIKEGKL